MRDLCERLLVPVDSSGSSLAVGELAIQLARRYGSELVFVFVVDVVVRELVARMSRRPAAEVQRELEETAQHTLNHLMRVSEREGVPARKVLRSGTIHAEVVAVAEAEATTLIVLGRPLQSELRGLFLGRVLHQIVEDACCPVLVLKPGAGWREADE